MTYREDDLDDTWAGLEPVQTGGGSRWPAWLAAAGAVFLLSCICLGGTYLLMQQYQRPEPGIPPAPTGAPPTPLIESPAPGDPTPPPTPPVEPTATLDIPSTVTLPSEVASPPPAAVSGHVEAIRLGAAPVIDGDLSEWSGISAYESTYIVFRAPGWDGNLDLRPIWRLGWDDHYLYIGVEVHDDVHVQNQTGNQIFRGDSLEMQFETNPARRSSRIAPSNFQIIFSPGDFAILPPSAFRFRGNDEGQIRDYTGHNINVAAQKTAAGYNLEAAIPWADLHMTPSPDFVLGAALNASDNDTPGTAVQEVMVSNVPTRTLTDPTTWGTLTLR